MDFNAYNMHGEQSDICGVGVRVRVGVGLELALALALGLRKNLCFDN
jgi:hypothetical protein